MSLAKINDGSVYDGIRYTSSVVLPKVAEKPATSLRKGYSPLRRARRAIANSVIVMSILLMGILGGGGSAQTASANWFTDAIKGVFCGPEAYFNQPEIYTAGPTGLGFSPSRYIGQAVDLFRTGDPNFNTEPRTAYEKYGMSGTTWTVYRGHEETDILKKTGNYDGLSSGAQARLKENLTCVPFIEVLSTYAANQMFSLTKMLTAIGTATYAAAYDASIMDQFTESIADVIEGPNGNNGLRDALYFEFLGVMLMLGAVYLAWIGLVKRSSTTAGSAALWMLGSVIVGSLIIYNPTVIPRAANATVDAVTGAIMTGTTGIAIPDGQSEADSLCYLPDGGGDSQKRITRIVECSLWSAFVYTPWVSGQFGTSPSQNLSTDNYTAPNVQIGSGKTVSGNWALYQLDQQSMDIAALGSGDRAGALTAKQANWGNVRDHMTQNQGELWSSWTGEMSRERLGVASLSVVASIAGLAVIVTLSVLMIAYQIGLALLMFISPLFLLVGAHPGFGRGIALRWAEMLVNTVLKRILLSALLGVMVAFYSIILGGANSQNSSYDYGTAMIMIIALSVAGLMYRKTLMEAFSNIKFGGTQAGIEQSPRGLKQGGSILAGAATGVLTGGVGAAKVAAVAGGGKAGMAAAVRTVAKSTVDGAQRGAYAMSPKAAVVGAVRSGSRNAKTEVAGIQAKQKSEASAQERMLADAYGENSRFDAKKAGEQERAAQAEAAERDPSNYARKQEQERAARNREIQEFLKHKDDPEYMERLQAKHGGKIPTYLTNAAKPASSASGPRPQSDSVHPGQGRLFDDDNNMLPDVPTGPVQDTLFDLPDDSSGPRPQPKDSSAPHSAAPTGSSSSRSTTPSPQETAPHATAPRTPSTPTPTSTPAQTPSSAGPTPITNNGSNGPGAGSAPTRRSAALPAPSTNGTMGQNSGGALPMVVKSGTSAEVAKELREIRRDVNRLNQDTQKQGKEQGERIDRLRDSTERSSRRRPPPPPQPPRRG